MLMSNRTVLLPNILLLLDVKRKTPVSELKLVFESSVLMHKFSVSMVYSSYILIVQVKNRGGHTPSCRVLYLR